MNALWVVKISATAFTMQMLARCIEKPITTASIIDKERIMSGCPELSPDGRSANDDHHFAAGLIGLHDAMRFVDLLEAKHA